ncbi:MAG: hypothetical protein QXD04_04220 [Candidatus Bathyarchaeia archaeon]
MSGVEPFLLYVSKRFLDKASKSFKLGLIVRRPLVEILRKIDVDFKELDRDEARSALEGIAEAKGLTVTASQLVKSLALAFLLPTGLFYATLKKVYYRAGIETEGFIILEFLAEIPRALRASLFYDLWLVVPKTPEGAGDAKRLVKAVVEMVEAPPITAEEWREAEPIREKLAGRLDVKGLNENLWTSL